MKTLSLLSGVIMIILSIVLTLYHERKRPKKKPQEPEQPFPYYSETVTFPNAQAGITLSGTLTVPSREGNHPAVILISGSGPQNRDDEAEDGHKPFLIISDHLTKKGIAVLRYDDRGVGLSSGDFTSATSLDFATDVESAFNYLKTRKETNEKKIGLIGHSEGGLIASIVASRSDDPSFIVLLGAPGIRGGELLIKKNELIQRASGVSEVEIETTKRNNEEIVKLALESEDHETLRIALTRYSREKFPDIASHTISREIEKLSSPWYHFLLNYDPANTLEKVTCAVLALGGEKDLQVPSKDNLKAIGDALKRGRNENVMIKELQNLNHFFQDCETGLPNEYGTIEQTFSPTALDEISGWILRQVAMNEPHE